MNTELFLDSNLNRENQYKKSKHFIITSYSQLKTIRALTSWIHIKQYKYILCFHQYNWRHLQLNITNVTCAFIYIASRLNQTARLIISSEIAITKLAQTWDNPELFIQCNINLRCYNFQRWEPFTHTVDSLRCLNLKTSP